MAVTRAERMAVRRKRQAEEVTLYVDAQLSLARISQIKGVSVFVVRKDLLDAGIILRSPGRPKRVVFR